MDCLDANVVQDLMAGALPPAVRTEAVVHLDGCADCRALLGVLAKGATAGIGLDATFTPPPDVALDATMAPPADGLGATIASQPATPASGRSAVMRTGQTFGRYKILERLGAGAMGVVYRAEDRELGRDVALKQLHRPDPQLTDRLVREARSMAQVNHPNVVAVYDVGVAAGVTYIAMEMVAGQSLRNWQRDRHAVREIVEAYLAAGRGLAAAHDAGIVHRDFKPDNVLVGRDGRVRVTDFGLAASRTAGIEPDARASTTMSDVNLTTSGSVLGTPAYMAPEQFAGGNVDARTDQFNFCVALYEALYGERPFEGKTFDELGSNVEHGRIKPAPAGATISRGLRAIVLRGLSTRPGDRYPSMTHLLAELGRDRAKPWRRTSIAAATVAVALALGLFADAVVRDRVSTQIRDAFQATGKQTERAFELLAGSFDVIADQVYILPVMRQVAGNRDQADFGLGDPAVDAQNLTRLHDELMSVDWRLARLSGKRYQPVIAIADYKGRLLFTSAAPNHWQTDLAPLPWVKRALAGQDKSVTLVPTTDRALTASGLLGPTPPPLAFVFARTLVLSGEAASQFMFVIDAVQLLDQIRLDDQTRLSVVAPDGTSVGDVPANVDGFQVQAIPLREERDGAVVGEVVMARATTSVLSLFPHARLVFAIAMCAALALALVTLLRARQITQARVETL